MTPAKLNGWQRLWVMFSCLLLIPAVLLAAINFPTNKEVVDELEIQLREKGDYLDGFDMLLAAEMRSVKNLLNGKSVKESQEKINKSKNIFDAGIVLDEQKIHRLYEEAKTKKMLGFFQSAGTWLGIWLILVGSIYLLGWSVGWVVRGFRQR